VNPFLLTVKDYIRVAALVVLNIFCKHFACFLSERGGVNTSTAFYYYKDKREYVNQNINQKVYKMA